MLLFSACMAIFILIPSSYDRYRIGLLESDLFVWLDDEGDGTLARLLNDKVVPFAWLEDVVRGELDYVFLVLFSTFSRIITQIHLKHHGTN